MTFASQSFCISFLSLRACFFASSSGVGAWVELNRIDAVKAGRAVARILEEALGATARAAQRIEVLNIVEW